MFFLNLLFSNLSSERHWLAFTCLSHDDNDFISLNDSGKTELESGLEFVVWQ